MTGMLYPNPKMLLRIAQADAYCMATEYIKFPRDFGTYFNAQRFERYVAHPTHGLRPGTYTDDTQMSIAVAEFLLSGLEPSKLSFAEAFYAAFKRDPRNGYSRGFQVILESVGSGQQLLERLVPTSTKNGAAMRSVPLGVIRDVGVLCDTARVQASVTHDTPDGIISSTAVALLSHWSMYEDVPWDVMATRLAERWPEQSDVFVADWPDRPVCDMTREGGRDVGLNTVTAVCTLLRKGTSLMDILKRVIAWGGDTDSVAAIAWGIASSRFRDENPPEFLEHTLEPGGSYGAGYLLGLGSRLMEMSNA